MLEQITESLLLVTGKNNGRFPFSHSVLILCESSKAVLVDTGCGLNILKKIREKFNIVSIINSHTHPDHSAGNWLFQKNDCPIYVPEEGFETSGNIAALSRRFVEPEWLANYWRNYIVENLGLKDCRPLHRYNSKSKFDFGEICFVPIYTPGHTVDHYCLYEPHKRILLSFDYDLTSFGPWYGHRESSITEFKCSIDKLIDLNPNIVVSGHKGIITGDIVEQLLKFREKFDERDRIILELLEKGSKTIDQLVEKAPIYGSFPYAEPLLKYFEGQMIKKHLIELEKRGKTIKRESSRWRLA